MTLVCVICGGPIEPALAHISTTSLGGNLQRHIVDITTHLGLRGAYHVVICILICLQSVRSSCVVALVVLRVVRRLLSCVELLLLLMVNSVAKKSFVGAVHCSCLRLNERVLKGITHVNTRLTKNLCRMVVSRNLVVKIHIRMLVTVRHLIGS
jgi:hypothetical protein